MITKNYLSILLFFIATITNAQLSFEQHQINENELAIKFIMPLDEHQLLYKDSLIVSVDEPAVILSDIKITPEPINRFDEVTKQKKMIYQDLVEITAYAVIANKSDTRDPMIHILYHINTDSEAKHEYFPLTFKPISSSSESNGNATIIPNKNYLKHAQSKNTKKMGLWDVMQRLSLLLKRIQSLPIQLILIFLLGLLLSLTPCIYPMIPITIGILNSQARSRSFIGNFMRSFSYSMGIALTFAMLGLITAYTGFAAGSLLVHPVFVIGLVALLSYLAFSMLGLYELYIPRFLQIQSQTTNGSLFSSFLFGAASGTIASPCVSPGLILVLSLAALCKSVIISFLMLFTFGVGLSMPLLLVGTFSSSLTLLPNAGSWMVEIKKIFGLLLLGVCLYYLSNIIPIGIILIMLIVMLFVIGIYYLYSLHSVHSPFWRKSNALLAILFIAISIALIPHTYIINKATTHSKKHANLWETNYQKARDQAIEQHKKLFIDFWAQYCSICKAISKKLESDPNFINALNYIIPVSIDGTHETSEPYAQLKKQFSITGFPTFLLIDPSTGIVIKQWGSELYHMPIEELISTIIES